MTRKRASLNLDSAKKNRKLGKVAQRKDAKVSGILRKYVHAKNRDKIRKLPTYIAIRVPRVSFFGTVSFIYIKMLNARTMISHKIANVLFIIYLLWNKKGSYDSYYILKMQINQWFLEILWKWIFSVVAGSAICDLLTTGEKQMGCSDCFESYRRECIYAFSTIALINYTCRNTRPRVSADTAGAVSLRFNYE